MKKIVILFASVYYFFYTQTDNKFLAKEIETLKAKCEIQNPQFLPEIKPQSGDAFNDVFNYRIHQITPGKNSLKFHSLNYDFVFCRASKTWTIQPATVKPDTTQYQRFENTVFELANTPYQTIEIEGKKYQYRVILEPNPFGQNPQPAKEIIFELIKPNNVQAERQILYTLEQIKKLQLGDHLGIPYITAAIAKDNQIFWTVRADSRAKGAGIATIISYTPKNNQFKVIQPEEIAGQQIIDLAITGTGKKQTFWLATQISGQFDPYLPGRGLIAYRPNSAQKITSYNVNNSPLIGAIPTKLMVEQNTLWIGTGNGICQVPWQEIDLRKKWSCWRFILLSKLPDSGVPIYSSLFAKKSAANFKTKTVEVLWWKEKRYEIVYQPGFSLFSQSYTSSWQDLNISINKQWHKANNRLVRGFDEVAPNLLQGGSQGIAFFSTDINTIRGDLEVSENKIQYYSGWVEDRSIEPYLSITSDPK